MSKKPRHFFSIISASCAESALADPSPHLACLFMEEGTTWGLRYFSVLGSSVLSTVECDFPEHLSSQPNVCCCLINTGSASDSLFRWSFFHFCVFTAKMRLYNEVHLYVVMYSWKLREIPFLNAHQPALPKNGEVVLVWVPTLKWLLLYIGKGFVRAPHFLYIFLWNPFSCSLGNKHFYLHIWTLEISEWTVNFRLN